MCSSRQRQKQTLVTNRLALAIWAESPERNEKREKGRYDGGPYAYAPVQDCVCKPYRGY